LRAVTPATDLAEAVTLARGAGARAIKIYGNLAAPLVARIVREAHRQGLQAWAHGAVFPATPREVVEAGVDSVSHVCMLAYAAQPMPGAYHDRASVDEARFAEAMPREVAELFALMERRGTVLDATNYVYETIERMRAELPEGRGPPTYCSAALSARLTAAAHAADVEIAAGTDAFAPADEPWPALYRELEILVAAGMTPLAAIRSGTLVGARALGREQELGTIAPGKLASFVFVAADASRDIGALRKLRLVVKRGTRYRREDYVAPTRGELGARGP
jgi:imidazolonepropionase-like amidohydrolase